MFICGTEQLKVLSDGCFLHDKYFTAFWISVLVEMQDVVPFLWLCASVPPPIPFCFLPLKGNHLEYQTKAFSACGLGTFVSQCLHSAFVAVNFHFGE